MKQVSVSTFDNDMNEFFQNLSKKQKLFVRNLLSTQSRILNPSLLKQISNYCSHMDFDSLRLVNRQCSKLMRKTNFKHELIGRFKKCLGVVFKVLLQNQNIKLVLSDTSSVQFEFVYCDKDELYRSGIQIDFVTGLIKLLKKSRTIAHIDQINDIDLFTITSDETLDKSLFQINPITQELTFKVLIDKEVVKEFLNNDKIYKFWVRKLKSPQRLNYKKLVLKTIDDEKLRKSPYINNHLKMTQYEKVFGEKLTRTRREMTKGVEYRSRKYLRIS